MVEMVLGEIILQLNKAGINAIRHYPDNQAETRIKACVCVFAVSSKCVSSGLGDYLGVRPGVGGGSDAELYGRRLEMELGLDVFSPFVDGSEECLAIAGGIERALLDLPSGIRILETVCGEVSPDEELGAFRCRCTMLCGAYFVAESKEENNEFVDFVLKGTVDSDK